MTPEQHAKKLEYMRSYSAKNRERIKARSREYYKNNRERHLEYQMKFAYGIDQAQWDELFKKQNGLCALCGSAGCGGKRAGKLYVDHCHETKRIRGLLCHKCNGGIGALGDNEDGLLRALAYVRGE
jgi:hypothetical protein